MRKLRMQNNRLIVIALVILMLISIGYAALTTTLTINGTANIGSSSWLVYFTNVVQNANNNVVQVLTEPTTIGKETTTLNFAVSMDTPGQKYEFTVDVVNEGSIDAMIATETENLITQGLSTAQKKYLDYKVTYINGAPVEKNDKLAAGETKTLKVRLEFKTDVAATDLPQTAETISLSYSINYVQADDNAVAKGTTLPEIGDTVKYKTTMNGVELNKWKVFYVDGDYTYIILADYLPNSAIDTNQTYFNKLVKSNGNSIYANYTAGTTDLERRTYLINALSEKSNWDSLLTGTINGHNVNETRSEHVYAMGAPDIELWENSWNATYPADTLYTRYANDLVQSSTTYDGWYIGDTANPSSTYINLNEKEGYNNTLYYPHKSAVDGCYGYMLASSSASNYSNIFGVHYNGNVNGYSYSYSSMAARPIISLPSYYIKYMQVGDNSEENAKFVDGLADKTHSFGNYAQVTKFERASTLPATYEKEENIVSTKDSDCPIYMWNENNVLYWYSEVEHPELPANSSQIFAGFSKLTDASGIKDWNTTNVTNMATMFGGCSLLDCLNFSYFDTSNVTNMNGMISDCSQLRKIIVSEKFVTDKVTESTDMFKNCTALRGGNGTTYDSSKIDASMAHIDIAENPGYFTLVGSPLTIGDTVNYSTTLNNVTLDNWKVFYVDGDYTYIILADYLPNSAIDTNKTYFNKLSKNGNYSIYISSSATETGLETNLERRTYLINALSEKSNWDGLLVGTINGKSVNVTRNEHVFAMGAPDIELWKNSWNALYPADTIYTKYADNLTKGSTTYDGWYIGNFENPNTISLSLNSKVGYYNNILYYPHKEDIDSNKCFGYWLASTSAFDCSYILGVNSSGIIDYVYYANPNYAARPIISLPTSIVNQ